MRSTLFLLVVLSACATSRPTAKGDAGPAPGEPSTAPPAGPFGTAHRFNLMEASADGRWLIACQAREDTDKNGRIDEDDRTFAHPRFGEGDRAVTYLFLDSGLGTPIEDFLGADVSGRYLAVVRNQTLILLDVWTREERELVRYSVPDSTRPDALWPPPVARFSSDSRHMLYLREAQGRVSAVVRELSSGREQQVESGAGELRNADFSDAGDWVNLWVHTEDIPEGEPRERPVHSSSRLRGSCKLDPKGERYRMNEDMLVWRARRVEGGPLHELRGAARIDEREPLTLLLGRFILRRGEAGELFAEDGSGRRTEWVPAFCEGRILVADPRRELVVVACTYKGPESLATVELHGAEIHQPLDFHVTYRDEDSAFSPFPIPRLVSLPEGFPEYLAPDGQVAQFIDSRRVLIDLETRALHRVDDNIVTTRGLLALLWAPLHFEPHEVTRDRVANKELVKSRRRPLSLWDVETGKRTLLAEHATHWVFQAGSLVLAGGLVVDMESRQVVGRPSVMDTTVMALDKRGRILRGKAPPQEQGRREPSRDVWGPVSWEPLVR
ncbi:hypothetical protein HUW62_08505 [Myxococcus sp. AM011]|uniref:hypothetical protein n=1 Tax=Myxococcus sp. AM011 TaxID=2745200 RepID=UPI00159557B3|nr:hypothetical protein [Myxococcus sp. AM011]NVJ21255.1 hypothetical protein [Myxococcus sp. AM011]